MIKKLQNVDLISLKSSWAVNVNVNLTISTFSGLNTAVTEPQRFIFGGNNEKNPESAKKKKLQKFIANFNIFCVIISASHQAEYRTSGAALRGFACHMQSIRVTAPVVVVRQPQVGIIGFLKSRLAFCSNSVLVRVGAAEQKGRFGWAGGSGVKSCRCCLLSWLQVTRVQIAAAMQAQNFLWLQVGL